jgi:hypothetical protein
MISALEFIPLRPLSPEHNPGKYHNMNVNKYNIFKHCKFKYVGEFLSNQIRVYEEMKIKLNLGNDCHTASLVFQFAIQI